MTSATLYVEGPDLGELLAAIAAEHGPTTKVLAVTRPRRGGVAGFFATEIYGVSYQVDAGGSGAAAENAGGPADNVTASFASAPPPTGEPVATTPIPAPLYDFASYDFASYDFGSSERRADPSPGRHSANEADPGADAAVIAPPVALSAGVADRFAALLERADAFDGPAAPVVPALNGPATPIAPAPAAAQPVDDRLLAAAADVLAAAEGVPSEAALEFARVLAAAVGPIPAIAATIAAASTPPSGVAQPASSVPASPLAPPSPAARRAGDVYSAYTGSHLPHSAYADADFDSGAVNAVGVQALARPPLAPQSPAPAPQAGPPATEMPATQTPTTQMPTTERSGDRKPTGIAARARLGMLAAMRDVGVPVPLSPEPGETSLYRAVEQVIGQLPAAPSAPHRAGEILALVGPLAHSRNVVAALADQLHIPAAAAWVVDHSAANGTEHVITGPHDAARRAEELRGGDVPAIVIIDTAADDRLAPGQISWCAQVLAALAPTAVWAVVDATRKTADVRAELDRLGPLHGLAVHSLARTSSPATVWDLDIPVALLDGRAATTGSWAALLFDALQAPSGPQTAGME